MIVRVETFKMKARNTILSRFYSNTFERYHCSNHNLHYSFLTVDLKLFLYGNKKKVGALMKEKH